MCILGREFSPLNGIDNVAHILTHRKLTKQHFIIHLHRILGIQYVYNIYIWIYDWPLYTIIVIIII